uniref:Uncharacterized protein n=1 Tax=Anthurium amnicola TaxID=1678845 RepID=A0A1D1Y661_9ARAE
MAMEPRPLSFSLALALLLTANSPLLSLSASPPRRLHSHFSSTMATTSPLSSPPPPSPPTPFPPPPPPPPPPPSPPPPPPPSSPPPPPSSPRPPHSPPPPRNPPPPSPPRLSARPNVDPGAPGRPPPHRPLASCKGVSQSGCPRHWPPEGWRGGRPLPEPSRGDGRELNHGKKVGLAFLAVGVVLQLVFGGFLIYRRWQIGKLGYRRDVASSSPSALPSAS